MKKNTKILSIILLLIVIGIAVFFAVQQSFIQTSEQQFIQYTGRPLCGSGYCDRSTDPNSPFTGNTLYSSSTSFNTGNNIFKFDTVVSGIIQNKYCKDIPSSTGNFDIKSTYIDSDNCQHYSYTQGVLTKNCVCAGSQRACIGDSNWESVSSCFYGAMFCTTRDCSEYSRGSFIADFGGAYYSGSAPGGNINRGCYAETTVYQNGNKIDLIRSTSPIGRTYYDDGTNNTGYNGGTKTGITFDPFGGSWFSNSDCYAFTSAYILKFANNSFDIKTILPTKTNYITGENISVDVVVTNNNKLSFPASLNVYYSVPTIIGSATSTVSQGVTINSGENKFTYSIPSSSVTENLFITPELIINYSTSNIEGVNIRDSQQIYQGIKSFPSVEIFKVLGDKVNLTINTKPLQLSSNQLVVSEAFSGGTTISKTSIRYPVVAFSAVLPVIVIDGNTNAVTTNKKIYDDLDSGITLQIPSNQVWNLFYVINNNYQLPTICDILDVKTNKCTTVNPGIVTACSQGQFDPSLGLCVIQGQSITLCPDGGRLDITLNKCVFSPPIQYLCPDDGKNWVYNIDTNKCELKAQEAYTC